MRLSRRAIGAACGARALGMPAVRAQTPAPLVLHPIGPLTGVLAASNQEAMDGVRLFLDAFNARGGLRGREVRLQTPDDAQDPKRALEHFEALVAICQQHATGLRRFGLLLADDAFGRDTLAGMERTFKELGLEATVAARIDNRRPDVTAALQQMLAQRPQVVLLIVSAKAAADFVRGYRAAGAQATFISLSNTSNNDYIKALGDQAAGAIAMQVMPSPFAATTPLTRE